MPPSHVQSKTIARGSPSAAKITSWVSPGEVAASAARPLEPSFRPLLDLHTSYSSRSHEGKPGSTLAASRGPEHSHTAPVLPAAKATVEFRKVVPGGRRFHVHTNHTPATIISGAAFV